MGTKITGMNEVQRNLKKYQKEIPKVTTKGLMLVGETGVAILKQNTPVDEGRLRASMTYTIDGKQEGLESKATRSDAIDKNPKSNIVILGTNVIYARRVEYFAKNCSAGYFFRSFNQIQRVVKGIMQKEYKRALK